MAHIRGDKMFTMKRSIPRSTACLLYSIFALPSRLVLGRVRVWRRTCHVITGQCEHQSVASSIYSVGQKSSPSPKRNFLRYFHFWWTCV